MNRHATDTGLRTRADLEGLLFAISAPVTVVLMAFAPNKFLGSVAWKYIVDHLPGGKAVLMVWLLVAAGGMVAAIACPRMPIKWLPYMLGGAWYIWVAVFQVVCALSEDNGPLGFMGWGPLGIVVLIYGLGQTRWLR